MDASLPPYRVEWRPDLVTRYLLIKACQVARGTPESAEAVAADSLKKWGGYTRIISQHVIETNDPTLDGTT